MPKPIAGQLAWCTLLLALHTPADAAAQALVHRSLPVHTVSPGRGAAGAEESTSSEWADFQRHSGDPAGTATLLAGGALAAGAAGALGAVIGYSLTRHEGGEDPGVTGVAWGWLAGPALATPLAVHVLNNHRGSLALSYGVAAGVVIASVVAMDTPVIFITSPALQAIAATVVQRRTGR